jgi:hypothetical protein
MKARENVSYSILQYNPETSPANKILYFEPVLVVRGVVFFFENIRDLNHNYRRRKVKKNN